MATRTGFHSNKQNTSIGRVQKQCPICQSSELEYEFIIDGYPGCSCRKCSLLFLNPQPPPQIHPAVPLDEGKISGIAAANACARLDLLSGYSGVESGSLLLIGNDPALHAESLRRGLKISTLSISELESEEIEAILTGSVDACIICKGLESAVDPNEALQKIRRLLIPEGVLMVVAPTLDSRTARLFRSQWWEFNQNNRFYFSADTLQCLLTRAGFGDPIIVREGSMVSLHYMREKLATMRLLRYRILGLLIGCSPPSLRNRVFRFLHTRTVMIARSSPMPVASRLSVVVPVYNEKATFVALMEQLLQKSIPGVDIEIIIVESNSSDGTREQVLAYKSHPRVKVILEERALGKGHAVRKGFESATGDIILIQDADLEYDIGDYDSLLEPILRYEQNFVIGSRHTLKGRFWKMRQFNDAAGLAAFFNFGHLVFLTLFNVIYRQRLQDPFSMFKVFRRQCLYGLVFECNRFDFDFELTIKLLRKGYSALELPVNYRARSFSEGKKVSMVRDPLTWLRALIKFRNSPLYPGMKRR